MKALILILALTATPTWAVPVIALMPKPGVLPAAAQPAPPSTLQPLCLWQVPGKLDLINVYSITRVVVSGSGTSYQTRVWYGSGYSVTVEIPAGVDVQIHINGIKAAAKECQR